jgi:hypothetical protein
MDDPSKTAPVSALHTIPAGIVLVLVLLLELLLDQFSSSPLADSATSPEPTLEQATSTLFSTPQPAPR